MVSLQVKPTVFIGPPGTGKTTTLIATTAEEVKTVKPEDFLFLSFTKVAAQTIINRFESSDDVQLAACTSRVKTLHSFTFQALGLDSDRMMEQSDWDIILKDLQEQEVISDLLMEIIERANDVEVDKARGRKKLSDESIKDDALTVFDLARARLEPVAETARWFYNNKDMKKPFRLDEFITYVEVISATTEAYMQANRKYDFARCIEEFGNLKPEVVPAIKVVVVDEAQDLSKAQWKCIELLSGHADRIYVAGDDDQAIFQWNGGDVNSFIAVANQGTIKVLGQSYRLPAAAHRVALNIQSRISNSIEKTYAPKAEEGYSHLLNPKTADFKSGDWLVLATTKAQLKAFGEGLESLGVPYTYYGVRNVKVEYIQDYIAGIPAHEDDKQRVRAYAVLERQEAEGYNIQDIPNVELWTTYVVKGDERQNVIVLDGVSLPDTKDMDSLNRLLYVSVTRAAERLFVVHCPNAKHHFSFRGINMLSLTNILGVEVPAMTFVSDMKLGGYTSYPSIMKDLMKLYLTGETDAATIATHMNALEVELSNRHLKPLGFDLADLTKAIEEYLSNVVALNQYNSVQAQKTREAEVAREKAQRQKDALRQLTEINNLQAENLRIAKEDSEVKEELQTQLNEERAARSAQEDDFQAQLLALQSKFQS